MLRRIVSTAVLCMLAISLLAGCSKTVSYKDHLSDYVKTMDYRDGFKILQLTDIHWNGSTQIGDEGYGSEGYLRKVINEAVAHAGRIDLIEVTGGGIRLRLRAYLGQSRPAVYIQSQLAVRTFSRGAELHLHRSGQ